MDKKYKKMIKVMLEKEELSEKRKSGFLRASGFYRPKAQRGVRRPKGCIPVGQSSILLRAKRRRSSKDNAKTEEPWFLYILKCNDGSLYTGIAKNLEKRFKMHNNGKASRYTRTRLPVELVYHENCRSRAHALVRECKIKGFPKEKKEKLIKGD